MIQDIFPKVFHNEYQHKQPEADARILLFRDRKCLLKQDRKEGIIFPEKEECGEDLSYTYLFRIDEEEYFLGQYHEEEDLADLKKSGYDWEENRIFRTGEPQDRCFAGVTGFQLSSWYGRHQYCGSCGAPLIEDGEERMMRCPLCGEMYYPQICPAVIIGIVHQGKLLMSRYRDRAYRRFALLAGFNETGESIEQTVHREVWEEVGLHVKNLKYYKSQPWPFSDTLLMGFFCELDGQDDTITLDDEELIEAGWYLPSEVPEDQDHASLTGEMMALFRECDGILPEQL